MNAIEIFMMVGAVVIFASMLNIDYHLHQLERLNNNKPRQTFKEWINFKEPKP